MAHAGQGLTVVSVVCGLMLGWVGPIGAGSAPTSVEPVLPGGTFTPVTHTRLLDTRTIGPIGAGGALRFQVTGRAGIPTTAVAAVVVNVAVVGPSKAGYVTAYAAGTTRPGTSNLTFRAGQTVSVLSLVAVGADGGIQVYASQATHVIVDVTGWFSTPTAASDRVGRFRPLPVERVADSRVRQGFNSPGPGQSRSQWIGGGQAVVLNVTVVAPSSAGYLTVYPTGTTRPATSSINFAAGEVRSNRVVVALHDGSVTYYNSAGTTPIVVDVVGRFTDGTGGDEGGYYVPVVPVRLVDTRSGIGDMGTLQPDRSEGQPILGRAGIPDGTGTGFPVAAWAQLTVVNPSANGGVWLSVSQPYPGAPLPGPYRPDLQFLAGRTETNAIVARQTYGYFVLNNGAGTTPVVIDLLGYFALPAHPVTLTTTPGESVERRSVDLSGTGRFVGLAAEDADLVPGDSNALMDGFVVDQQTGTVVRVSVGDGEQQANGPTHGLAVSDDGRYAAFVTSATNLVTGQAGGAYVRDTVAGTTTRVDRTPEGAQPDSGPLPWEIDISADGGRVLFVSGATDLVPGDTNGVPDVFVHDRATGSTRRVNVSSTGAQANRTTSFNPHDRIAVLAGGGDHVVFISGATNLVPNDVNQATDVFVHDLGSGVTTRENVTSAGEEAGFLGGGEYGLSISDDGRVVVFHSRSRNLRPGEDDLLTPDAYVRDRPSGGTTQIKPTNGQPGSADFAQVSGDGSTVVFTTYRPDYDHLWRDSGARTLYSMSLPDGSFTAIRGYGFLGERFIVSRDARRMLFHTTVLTLAEPQ